MGRRFKGLHHLITLAVDNAHLPRFTMRHIGFVAGGVEQHRQRFRRGDFLQHLAVAGIDHQHFRLLAVGNKGAVAGGIEAQVKVEMRLAVIQQFFARHNGVVLAVDGQQFAVGVGGIETLSLRVDRQARRHCPGAGNGRFQLQGSAVHHPNHALFAQTGNVDGVGLLIDRQLARLQRAHGFTALTLVQHQSPLHGAGFGVNGGDGAVNGIAKPQRTGGMVDSGAERLQIVVNNLRHVEGGGVKTIHNPALVQRTTLRSGNP